MMVTPLVQKTYTIAEYLEKEGQAEIRHEFLNGEIIAMAGGTTSHNEIITNFCLLLKPILRQQKGKVYTENVRLWIPSVNLFTYPDVMLVAQEPIYYSDNKTTITNPITVIEVLSNSTRDYDLGRKFGYYRSLESLQEYILVEPEETLIMIYRRGNQKQWSLTILDTLKDKLRLDSVGVEMSLVEIYEGVLLV